MKTKKLGMPSLNFDFMPILYGLGLIGIFWFLTPLFFPNFWGKFYGSDLFWPSIIAMIFCLIMWGQKYFLFMWIFFVILVMILNRFGDFKTENSKRKNIMATVVVWKINNSNDSTVVYSGPADVKINLPPATRIRITPECGRTVSVFSQGWDHSVILKGCTLGSATFPTIKKWIQIGSI